MTLESESRNPAATAALVTPRGRGAVATVRVRGAAAIGRIGDRQLFQAANGRPLIEQEIGRILVGRWGDSPAEEVVVCRRDGATIEIHCHGGSAAVARILADLESAGCRIVAWTEQSETEQGLLESDCREALSLATTLRTADILLDQAGGTLRRTIETLLMTSPLGRGDAEHGWKSMIVGLDEILAWAEFGLHLTRPWRVALTGRPNVGKSSLTNALLGYARSIVYDEPGTTRDVVTAETAFLGWPVQLADTAGIRPAGGGVEAEGIARARAHLATADCRIVVLDVSRPAEPEDLALLREWPGAFVVAHKVDLPIAWDAELPPEALHVSSLTGTGVEALAERIVSKLVPRVPPPGTAIPVTERQVTLLRRAREAAEQDDSDVLGRVLGTLLG